MRKRASERERERETQRSSYISLLLLSYFCVLRDACLVEREGDVGALAHVERNTGKVSENLWRLLVLRRIAQVKLKARGKNE